MIIILSVNTSVIVFVDVPHLHFFFWSEFWAGAILSRNVTLAHWLECVSVQNKMGNVTLCSF